MALIACPECGHQVSSLAAACPKCAAPIAQQKAARDVGQPVVTTEVTSKRIKSQKLTGLGLIAIGVIIVMSGPSATGSNPGGLFILAGIVVFVAAAFRGWWHHG